MRSPVRFLFPILLAGLGSTSCGGSGPKEAVAPVSVSVIVTDSTGAAWEGVEVYIIEAWTEWSDCVCKGKEPWNTDLTDEYGEVVFDGTALAYSELGFRERHGVAVVGEYSDNDEAWVRVLVGHDTLGWFEVDVPVTFGNSHPELFVEID